jgi:hypothetical protein
MSVPPSRRLPPNDRYRNATTSGRMRACNVLLGAQTSRSPETSEHGLPSSQMRRAPSSTNQQVVKGRVTAGMLQGGAKRQSYTQRTCTEISSITSAAKRVGIPRTPLCAFGLELSSFGGHIGTTPPTLDLPLARLGFEVHRARQLPGSPTRVGWRAGRIYGAVSVDYFPMAPGNTNVFRPRGAFHAGVSV